MTPQDCKQEKKGEIIMKKRTIILILTVILCLSLGGNILAFTDTVKTLEAHFSGIRITVDGNEITPHDANGNTVEPFIVDGTTYLPVRAVGEALGKEVGWDGATRTVSIGHAPELEAPWKDLHPFTTDGNTRIYDGSDPAATFTAAGQEHQFGVVLNEGWHTGKPNVIWNTNGLYNTMTFTVVCTYRQHDATMTITLGDVEYASYLLHWDDAPKTFTIPVDYAANVKISLQTSDNAKYAIYDISFEE